MSQQNPSNPDKELPLPASGTAHENPAPGGVPDRMAELDFDDGTDMAHPRGRTAREGGTWEAEGADSAPIGPPAEVRSDDIGPDDNDPETRRKS